MDGPEEDLDALFALEEQINSEANNYNQDFDEDEYAYSNFIKLKHLKRTAPTPATTKTTTTTIIIITTTTTTTTTTIIIIIAQTKLKVKIQAQVGFLITKTILPPMNMKTITMALKKIQIQPDL